MYLLGIDNGGSDIKCAVYDLNGKNLRFHVHRYR